MKAKVLTALLAVYLVWGSTYLAIRFCGGGQYHHFDGWVRF